MTCHAGTVLCPDTSAGLCDQHITMPTWCFDEQSAHCCDDILDGKFMLPER